MTFQWVTGDWSKKNSPPQILGFIRNVPNGDRLPTALLSKPPRASIHLTLEIYHRLAFSKRNCLVFEISGFERPTGRQVSAPNRSRRALDQSVHGR
jgi:hypothetical protein